MNTETLIAKLKELADRCDKWNEFTSNRDYDLGVDVGRQGAGEELAIIINEYEEET